jgi:nitric oxide reductase NorD protein
MSGASDQTKQPAADTAGNYHGIEFASVEPVLHVYCKALTGNEVDFTSGKGSPAALRNTWWSQLASGNPPDGHINVLVPASFMEYTSYDDNFGWYKAAVTQQIAHSEFSSFDFDFDRESTLFEDMRYQLKGEEGHGTSSFEKYFALFDDPRLAMQVFVAVENVRINYLVKHHYPGLKRSYRRMQEYALLALARVPGMTLRRAFIELLEGLEIDAILAIDEDALYQPLNDAGDILDLLCSYSATVEDSAEAAIRIYRIALTVPKKAVVSGAGGYSSENREPDPSDLEGQEFMGNFQTDRVKLDMEMKANTGQKSSMPMSAEDMEKLDGQKIGITDIKDVKFLPGSSLSSSSLPRGVNVYQFSHDKYSQVDRYQPAIPGKPVAPEADERLAYYDEWDFRQKRYVTAWCCVREKVLGEGNSYFYDKTLENRRTLAAEIKRQFERLPAEMLYKAKNLDDGDEFDLDLVIGELMDKRAGHTPSGKVYTKKKKIHRDVSVAFLLDMSGSTADLISKNHPTMQYDESIKYDFMKFVMQPRRRIIDIEKESIVLLCNAIETLGDSYGIYGFSGHGRANVQFLVIKDLNEPFGERIKRRVDQIAPIHGTRMGPAIRHTTARLDACGSTLKLLFLVSDGYPQDSLYGYDDDDKEYAIHDTKMALMEASKKNIIPFCLTVDSAGNDYLRTMCNDIGYEVLDDIETLPHRLPMLYKKLSV